MEQPTKKRKVTITFDIGTSTEDILKLAEEEKTTQALYASKLAEYEAVHNECLKKLDKLLRQRADRLKIMFENDPYFHQLMYKDTVELSNTSFHARQECSADDQKEIKQRERSDVFNEILNVQDGTFKRVIEILCDHYKCHKKP